ncbi:MAG: hypothetical protein MUO35_01535 [Anaerolineales bacterium]|nr:hypothetical protein [Anaerolineales bacterium]
MENLDVGRINARVRRGFEGLRFPFVLLALSVLAYGLLISKHGFYWDDLPIVWIWKQLGPDGLNRYFSVDRPVWGLLYQLSFRLLGASPLGWQVYAIGWRWASAVSLWILLRAIWPRSPHAADMASVFFLVYPGFGQLPIAIIYSHFFIVLTAFLVSLYCSANSARGRHPAWAVAGMTLSLVNLLCLEYFFVLELVRPMLVWMSLGERGLSKRLRARRTLGLWLPYLALFLAAAAWRAFFFGNQQHNYPIVLCGDLRAHFWLGMQTLLHRIVESVGISVVASWGHLLTIPEVATLGAITLVASCAVGLVAAVLVGGYALRSRAPETDRTSVNQVVVFGIAGVLLGGWPVWLTGLIPSVYFANDRLNLPFMVGACALLAGVILLLPLRARGHWAVAAILVGLASMWHAQQANVYRREWDATSRFFWQLAWRAPALEEGALVLTNELPMQRFTDNSLTAPLNWIYAPANHSETLPYLLFYPARRLGTSLARLAPDVSVTVDYRAAVYTGNTSRSLTLLYAPPGCLRVLDSVVEVENRMLSDQLREAMALSSQDLILSEGIPASRQVLQSLFGPEPSHAWCYYFETADLERQQGHWEEVAGLGDVAFLLDDHPNDPVERLPFIEGYAHAGRWGRALELTQDAERITPLMQPMLCRLWWRIRDETTPGPEQEATIREVLTVLGCPS